MEKIKFRLKSDETKSILKSLNDIRNRETEELERNGLVELLVPLLDKTNSKIIDHSLSILANMLLDQRVRNRFRLSGGAPRLVKIINNLEDAGVLKRGFRAVSNAALDPKLCRLLHQQGIASILGKRLKDDQEEQLTLVLLRCIRIVSDSNQYRAWLDEEGVYDRLGTLMQLQDPNISQEAVVGQDGCPVHPHFQQLIPDPANTPTIPITELIKTLLKCLAKVTHGATLIQAGKIMPAIAFVTKLAGISQREVWEHGLMILVNLSQHASLRPSLGNAGVVGCLVDLFDGTDLTPKETGHVITALCLYCRESVNRVKLRELGGCRVLVEVLNDETLSNLHDRVINSLLQFMYDNHSLNVLMSSGLIPSLVGFLDQVNSELSGKLVCKTGKVEVETVEPMESSEKPEVVDDSGDEAEVESEKVETAEEVGQERPKAGPVFRINSPSYQAVQDELEQFLQLREFHGAERSPRRSEYTPASPSSQIQSPDRSPLQLSCGYSPDRSCDTSGFNSPMSPGSPRSPLSMGSPRSPEFPRDFSPPSSPPYSPPDARYSPTPYNPAYSPIETFSDEEIEEEVMEEGVEEVGMEELVAVVKGMEGIEHKMNTKVESEKEKEKNKEDNQLPMDVQRDPPVSHTEHESQPEPSSSKPNLTSSNLQPEPNQATGVLQAQPEPNQATAELQTVPNQASSELQREPNQTSLDLQPKPSSSKLPPASKLTKLDQELFQCPVSPETMLEPPSKRAKLSLNLPNYKYSVSPISSPHMSRQRTTQENVRKMSESSDAGEEKKGEGDRLEWILMILSRLTQAERPHEDLTSPRTIQCLFTLMSRQPGSLGRLSRIFSRLSKNLYCLFPFLLHRHYSWVHLQLEQLPGSGCCERCLEHVGTVEKVGKELAHNLTLLAETGYGEGEICHRLVIPSFSITDKQCISISSALLVKQRRKLRNILVNHGSLETLLDVVEQRSDLVRDAVLSLCVLSGHLGIVAPNLTLPPVVNTECNRIGTVDLSAVTLVLDCGKEVVADRNLLASSSPVFAAMLEGGFSEASKSRIELPMTSAAALECLVHYLYKCSWCPVFQHLSAPELLEILALSDKFLQEELNIVISHQIIRGCMQEEFLLEVYRNSLQREYPVRCSETSLSACTVSTVLVGDMSTVARARLVDSLMQSELRSDFLDDVNKMIRKTLNKL